MVSGTVSKDPAKVAAGKAGMTARWGVPRRVRLDDFEPNERAAILAAIDARRAAKAARNEKASPVIETIGTGREVRRASVDPQRAA